MIKRAIYNKRVWMFILLPVIFLRIDIGGQENKETEHSELNYPELLSPELPDLFKGTDWEILATVEYDPLTFPFVPEYSDSLKKRDGQPIVLTGYMLPLSASEMQPRFILIPVPLGGCSFCVGGGGHENMVDVYPNKPLKFTYDPITVSGRLTLLNKDPSELFYRIDKANVVSERDFMK